MLPHFISDGRIGNRVAKKKIANANFVLSAVLVGFFILKVMPDASRCPSIDKNALSVTFLRLQSKDYTESLGNGFFFAKI